MSAKDAVWTKYPRAYAHSWADQWIIYDGQFVNTQIGAGLTREAAWGDAAAKSGVAPQILPAKLKELELAVDVTSGAAQGEQDKPFMYAIQDEDGNAYFSEHCVGPVHGDLIDEIEHLNDDLPEGAEDKYKIVPVYLAALSRPNAPVEQGGREDLRSILTELIACEDFYWKEIYPSEDHEKYLKFEARKTAAWDRARASRQAVPSDKVLVPIDKLTIGDCYRFGLDINTVRAAANTEPGEEG